MIDRVGGGFKDYAPLTLRLGLATIFILQGAQAIGDLGRNPHLEPILTMVIQLIGGLFLLIRFLTPWAAFSSRPLILSRFMDCPPLPPPYPQPKHLPPTPLPTILPTLC